MSRILIPVPLTNLPLIAERLGAHHEIVGAAGTTEADLVAAVGDVDVLIATGMDVTPAVFEAGTRLQVVGTPQVGVDRIDLDAARAAGVPVLSSQGLVAIAVAEFALGHILNLGRRIAWADRDLHGADAWRSRRTYAEPDMLLGRELRGRTIGIAGLGNIGAETARLVGSAFGCRVLGYDPVVDADEMRRRGAEKVDDFIELAAQVDFLVLHVPLIPATRHLVDAAVLDAMRPDAFLVNVARGGVVDDTALVEALRSGSIAGAALDVYEDEPVPDDSPLRTLDTLVMTPHIAGVTHEWNEQRSLAFVDRIERVLAGEQPDGLADPDVWPAFEDRRRSLVGR